MNAGVRRSSLARNPVDALREFEVSYQGNLTIIRRNEVESRTGLCRSTIYQRIKEGKFPPPIRVGTRSVRWVVSDIDNWVATQIAQSRAGINEGAKAP
jgi:prophage regulatory protein